MLTLVSPQHQWSFMAKKNLSMSFQKEWRGLCHQVICAFQIKSLALWDCTIMMYALSLHMFTKTVEGGSSHVKNSCIHGYKKPVA